MLNSVEFELTYEFVYDFVTFCQMWHVTCHVECHKCYVLAALLVCLWSCQILSNVTCHMSCSMSQMKYFERFIVWWLKFQVSLNSFEFQLTYELVYDLVTFSHMWHVTCHVAWYKCYVYIYLWFGNLSFKFHWILFSFGKDSILLHTMLHFVICEMLYVI